MKATVLRPNFWPPYWDGNSPELTTDDIGWDIVRRREAGSDKTKDIFDYYVGCLGMDLSLYYLDKDRFYYIDMMNGEVALRRENPLWDGKYDYERVSVYDCQGDKEAEDSFAFDSVEQLWNKFNIDGKPLSYVLEHSVIWLSS